MIFFGSQKLRNGKLQIETTGQVMVETEGAAPVWSGRFLGPILKPRAEALVIGGRELQTRRNGVGKIRATHGASVAPQTKNTVLTDHFATSSSA